MFAARSDIAYYSFDDIDPYVDMDYQERQECKEEIKTLKEEFTHIKKHKTTLTNGDFRVILDRLNENLRIFNFKEYNNEYMSDPEFELWTLCETMKTDISIIQNNIDRGTTMDSTDKRTNFVLEKLAVCENYQQGDCVDGNCEFFHPPTLCSNYKKGVCKYGLKCRFSHNPDDHKDSSLI